jgi:drug/metabolite transporter (DMT)-like permease
VEDRDLGHEANVVPVPRGATPAGTAAALGAVTCWGLGNVIIAAIPMNGLAIAFHRLWIGSLLYLAIMTARGMRLDLEALRHGWKGGVIFGLNIASFFVAVRTTTVANAVTISALQPMVIMVIAAIAFHERIRARHVASAVVATGGVALVTFGAAATGQGSTSGDLWAVVALLTWAGYFVASKTARRRLDTLTYMTVMNLVAFLVVAPLALFTGALDGDAGALDPGRVLAIMAVVLVPGSGHVLMNWAHEHTTLTMSSLATLGLPVISTAMAAAFLGQEINWVQAVGIAVVLVALAAVIMGDARQAHRVEVVAVEAPPDRPHRQEGS